MRNGRAGPRDAGAVAIHSLTGPPTLGPQERTERLVDDLSASAGGRVGIVEAVCAPVLEHTHRVLATAHGLRSHDVLVVDPRAVVEDVSA